MSTQAIINTRVFDGEVLHEELSLILRDGIVTELASDPDLAGIEQVWDLQHRLLVPGLIDLQVNGGGGVLFNQDPSVETIRRIGSAHRPSGTTGFLPTLISDTREKMIQAVHAVREARASGVPGVLGIHVEGPWLNPDYCGIHDPRHFRALDRRDIELLAAPENGKVLLTLAPEIAGPSAIAELTEAGIIVAAGHSGATYSQVGAAFNAGLSGFTHLYNAMSPLGSREPGMVGAALADDRSWMGIIADGHHIHPASFKLAVRAKQRGKSLLVTDAMATVGGDGQFEWNGQVVTDEDGCCRLPDGRLAGSSLDMITAVKNAMEFAGIDEQEALRMGSVYPARALGLDRELGGIAPGMRASFLERGQDYTVLRSWIDGQVKVHREATE